MIPFINWLLVVYFLTHGAHHTPDPTAPPDVSTVITCTREHTATCPRS
jgi:hypothetical protein